MLQGWHPNIYVIASISAVVSGYAIAAFVGIRARHLPASKPFAFMSFCGSTWCLYPLLTSLPLASNTLLFLARLVYTASGPTIAGFLHLAFAMAEDERQILRHRWLIGSYFFAFLLSVLVWTPWFITGLIRYAPFFAPIGGPLYHLLPLFYFIVAGYGVLVTIRGVNRPSGTKRNQLRYFLLASGIIALSPLLHFGASYLRWEPIPHDFLVLAFVVIVAVAIMRHQLLDIRIVLNKALVYSVLIACITASYLIVVLIAERLFQGVFGYHSLYVTLFVAFLIAIFFNPLRNRIQTVVDRALFKATPAELAAQREQLLVEVRKGDQMKAVATLAAGLAHEVKNPLTSIKTFTEHLENRYDDPEFRKKFKRIVGGEVERINLIVQQLLEFAKPVPPKLASVSLPTLIDGTLEFLNNELMQRGVHVERRYASATTVLGDSQQLKQVFLNLFLNSLQAMNGHPSTPGSLRPLASLPVAQDSALATQSNGLHGRIVVTTEVRGGELAVTITDNGSGIAPQDLPHIFDPFFTTKSTGTGLGLAVVQGIMKEHGGRIDIKSQPGQGTAVDLQFPVVTL